MLLDRARAAPTIADWGEYLMPRPKSMTQFGCHTHIKILQEVSHPYHNSFSSIFDELGSDAHSFLGSYIC